MRDDRVGIKLAEGACAEIHAWGTDGTQIVKLAKPNTNRFALERELQLCSIAGHLGLPVPRTHALVEVDGRNGIVFERVDGETILAAFIRTAGTRTDEDDSLHARETARILHRIHAHAADGLPDQQQSIARDISRGVHLDEAEKAAVIALMAALPSRQQLCHGDPNPGNFVLAETGTVALDWNNATLGEPAADLAEYVLMLRYAVLPSSLPKAVIDRFDAARQSSIRLFLSEYEMLSGLKSAEIAPWIVAIAARKLAVDGIGEAEKAYLLAEVRNGLAAAAGGPMRTPLS